MKATEAGVIAGAEHSSAQVLAASLMGAVE
jgi:hypothetical protein